MHPSRLPLRVSLITTASLLTGVAVQAGVIVPDLADGTAIFSSTSASGATVSAPARANGVTLAASITPTVADLTKTNGAVAVMEIGGTANGSGLWILNGDLWFIGHSSTNMAFPSSGADFNGSDSAIGVNLGALTADTQTNAFVTLNIATGTLITSLNSVVNSHSLTGVAAGATGWNWHGNNTVNFGSLDPFAEPAGALMGHNGYRGGLTYDNPSDAIVVNPLFVANNAAAFSGTLHLGQVFNAVSSVPEPSSAMLGLLGAFGLLRRRR
ncbi:MAG: PEP-CTERM sorting domain-containing protein [Verrucomicrobiota bacterium]